MWHKPLPGEPTASRRATLGQGQGCLWVQLILQLVTAGFPTWPWALPCCDTTVAHTTGCWAVTEGLKSFMALFHSKVNVRKSTTLCSHLISSPDHTASGTFPHSGCRPHAPRQRPASLSCSSRKTHFKSLKCSAGLSPRTDMSSCASRRVRTEPANATRDTKRKRGVVLFQNKAASHQE